MQETSAVFARRTGGPGPARVSGQAWFPLDNQTLHRVRLSSPVLPRALHPPQDRVLTSRPYLGGFMRSTIFGRATVAAVAITFATTVPAQQRGMAANAPPQNRITLEQYLDWEEVQTPQLSPDGTQILFSRRWVDKMNDKWESSVWLMNADGSHPRSLTQGSDVHWSPDGKRIAYVAKGEPSGQQV